MMKSALSFELSMIPTNCITFSLSCAVVTISLASFLDEDVEKGWSLTTCERSKVFSK